VSRRRRRPLPQSQSPGQDVRDIVREEITKALTLPPGTQTNQVTAGYLQALQQRGLVRPSNSVALNRDPLDNVSFGPGEPLFPAPIDPTLPSGRPAPRRWEYPVSWNLQTTRTRATPWSVLRDAADQVSIMRACIEVNKAAMTGLEWSFGVNSARARHLARQRGTSDQAMTSELQDKHADDIERLHDWWTKPDRINNWTFSEWLGALLEDQQVLDAVAVYPHMQMNGDLHSLELLDASCYSDDTEVLTRRGWLKFFEANIKTDWFATRNPKTKEFEWQQATYYHRAPFKGEMCHFRSRSMDVLVTPNHRMVIEGLPRALGGSRHRERGEVIVTAGELSELGEGRLGRRIPMTSRWEAADLDRFELPGGCGCTRCLAGDARHTTAMSFACSGDDFAAFMGMYLSEGCFTGGDQVAITQDPKSKGFLPFRELLERIFGRKVCHTGKSFIVGRKVLHDYLAQFGKAHEKYVPEIVKGMSARQLGIFWRFYMLGDGHYGVTETISTVSPHMADDLQEIAQKIGRSASVRSGQDTADTVMPGGRVIKAVNKRRRYTVALSRSEYRTWQVERVPYDGVVFCVSVPNEVLYVRRNGKPAWCGNTIKPLLDHRGATPQPPLASYQQILFGFPRGEFSQSPPEHVDAEFTSAIYGNVTGPAADTDTLIYKVRNRRTRSPYGFSNVEQALADIDLWLKRFDWLRSEYSAGVTPEMLVMVDTTMTPEQLRQYEAVFNDDLSGRTAERHRARFLPAGFNAEYPHSHEAKFTSDFDLHLVRLICAAFEVLPTSLGFTPNHGMGGMGGQSMQQAEMDSQMRRGTKPTAQWIIDLVNEVSTNYLHMPPEITFRFHGLDDENEEREANLLTGFIGSGLQTLNEGRDQLNLPRYEFPEANQPYLATPTGPAFLNVEVQPVGMPGNLPTAAQNQPGYRPEPPAPGSKKPSDAKPQIMDTSDGRIAERKKFLTFAKRRDTEWRDFAFKCFSPEVAAAANRLAAAGDIDACKALFELYDGG
jgi:hypothetical protein